jgi:hypothetical protein
MSAVIQATTLRCHSTGNRGDKSWRAVEPIKICVARAAHEFGKVELK